MASFPRCQSETNTPMHAYKHTQHAHALTLAQQVTNEVSQSQCKVEIKLRPDRLWQFKVSVRLL